MLMVAGCSTMFLYSCRMVSQSQCLLFESCVERLMLQENLTLEKFLIIAVIAGPAYAL
jgi:hypothetical protein